MTIKGENSLTNGTQTVLSTALVYSSLCPFCDLCLEMYPLPWGTTSTNLYWHET